MKRMILVGAAAVGVLALGLSCTSTENIKIGDRKIGSMDLPKRLPGEDIARAAGYGFAVDIYNAYVARTSESNSVLDGFDYSGVILNRDNQSVDTTGWTFEETYRRSTRLSSSLEAAARVTAPALNNSSSMPSVPGTLQDLDASDLTDKERAALKKGSAQ
jgi:hypothetical protein